MNLINFQENNFEKKEKENFESLGKFSNKLENNLFSTSSTNEFKNISNKIQPENLKEKEPKILSKN